MSKQQTNEESTKVWSNVDYTNTNAYKTIEAWKQAATENGLVLEFPDDFPNQPAGQLQRLRKLDGIAKGEVRKVITAMFKQEVHFKDKNNAPTTKEFLTYLGQFETTDYRGIPYAMSWEEGKHFEPKVVLNANVIYDQKTGLPLTSEKTLTGQIPIYDIELPKGEAAQKKLIDKIIQDTGTHKDNIKYYHKDLDVQNISGNRDGTFSYEDFVTSSIEQLKQMSGKGGGSKTLGYWRDRDGKLRDRDGNLV